MLGRKVSLMRSGQLVQHERYASELSHLDEWKHISLKNLQKYSYAGLVGTIRIYVRSVNFLKNKKEDLKTKLKERRERKLQAKGVKEVKPNNFLKMISEYKHKVGKIKHQIKEEENL
jgi:hypothetical protein